MRTIIPTPGCRKLKPDLSVLFVIIAPLSYYKNHNTQKKGEKFETPGMSD